ncbi:MAG: NPCBM/NEW2 domain-containing protein [Phycisphaerae bacterium]
MRWKSAISLLLTAVAAVPCGAREPEDEQGGYWALFANGQEVTGSKTTDWDRDGRPRLSGRWLFDPANPVRILCHTTRRPGAGGPRVVFANGDVLTGQVTGFHPGDVGENLPPRLAVVPASLLSAGSADGRERGDGENIVHVRTESIVRVVFGRARPRPYDDGTVFFTDGTAHTVSSVRWTPEGIKALGEDEIISGRFQELQEVHLPKVDRAAAVLADAAVPSGNPENPIGRMVTQQGAVLTYRLATRQSHSTSRRGYSDTYHWVQPAWSLTAICVPESSICVREYRAPTEVPLSLLDAETLQERSFTGFVWPWRRNRNVRGEMLRCGSYFGGLGIGTHSYSQVAFQLPPGARTFSCHVGLDRSVGAGGCVRCAVRRDSASGKQLWRSGLLTGSGKPVRVGPVPVDAAGRLVLVTEYAHDGRPHGADPGDIRDEVNWLAPMVTIDPAALRLTSEMLARYVPALEGWSISKEDLARAKLKMAALRDGPWQFGMDVERGELALSRKVKVSVASAVLDVAASRSWHQGGHEIDVWLGETKLRGIYDNGQGIQTRRHGPGNAVEQRWLLMPFLGREVTLTVKVRRDKDNRDDQVLLWHSLAFLPLVANLPPDGSVPTPDVRLCELEPVEAVWYPQDKGKRETKTQPPKPSVEKMHGLTLANSYCVKAGLRMTYRLRPGLRRFVAVVGSESPYHRGPFVVLVDGKEVWRSGPAIDKGRFEQVMVDIARGAQTISLSVEHNMTNGIWGQAGFMN